MTTLAGLMAAGGSAGAAALCSDAQIDTIVAGLKFNVSERHERACKALSGAPGYAALALALPRPTGNGIDQLHVMIIRQDGTKHRWMLPNKALANKWYLSGLNIDDSSYARAPGKPLFGLTVSYLRSDAVNSASSDISVSDELMLFRDSGGTLEKILGGLETRAYSFKGSVGCDSVTRKKARTVEVGGDPGTGAPHLSVASSVTVVARERAGQVCNRKEEPAVVSRHVLPFDGNRYVIPAALAH